MLIAPDGSSTIKSGQEAGFPVRIKDSKLLLGFWTIIAGLLVNAMDSGLAAPHDLITSCGSSSHDEVHKLT